MCDREDWLEYRFIVRLWLGADGASSISDLLHNDSGCSESLTCGEHLCFGNSFLIDSASSEFDVIALTVLIGAHQAKCCCNDEKTTNSLQLVASFFFEIMPYLMEVFTTVLYKRTCQNVARDEAATDGAEVSYWGALLLFCEAIITDFQEATVGSETLISTLWHGHMLLHPKRIQNGCFSAVLLCACSASSLELHSAL